MNETKIVELFDERTLLPARSPENFKRGWIYTLHHFINYKIYVFP